MPTAKLLSVPSLLALAVTAVAQGNAAGDAWPYSMDYGPCLMTTLHGRGLSDFTNKGVVVKTADGAVAFDTELLRLSAGWTDGWLQLVGTAYDGEHGTMPRLRGHKVCETRPLPGWAKDGDFADPRAVPYGPLPRENGRYHGLHRHGDDTVVEYDVGGMTVYELFSIEHSAAARAVVRTMELAPSSKDHWMVVADGPDGSKPGSAVAAGDIKAIAVMQWPVRGRGLVEVDSSTTGWDALAMGGPSKDDWLDSSSGTGATIATVPPSTTGGVRGEKGKRAEPQPVSLLQDGAGSNTDDDPKHCVWFQRRKQGNDDVDDGRFLVDLKQVVEVSRVNSFSWHRGYRAVQRYELFGSAAEAMPAADAQDPAQAGWRKIADVDTSELGEGDKHAASIWQKEGLGRCRHLLFVVHSGATMFSEIDVFADKRRSPADAVGRPDTLGVIAALKGDVGGAQLLVKDGRLLLHVPAHAQALRLQLAIGGGAPAALEAFQQWLPKLAPARALAPLLQPGPPRWGKPLATKGELGSDDGEAFAVDTITIPFDNPYGSRMRVCGFDFFKDGRAAVTTWNGDVWVVSGLDRRLSELRWQRFATGLFDPLGLRIVDDVVYVHGRDGITRLHDQNGDGEADFYECFNNDVTITPAFHEFAFDLQTDPQGNFYCSKGGPVNPGGRGFMKIAPHHGTVMKISKDGSQLEVFATGLRAPNGIGVSPDGAVVTSGDNEGTYIPRCRINWMTKPGFYGGVKDTAHRTPVPDQPDLPLCWMPMEIDNSSGGQCWVTSDTWAPLQGRLLHLSYGTCSVYLVLKEEVDGVVQGGVVRLPVNFSSSAMRARFNPKDGQLYVCGFKGWQTSAAKDGGFHRVRYTGKPMHLATGLRTSDQGVYVTFQEPLEAKSAEDVGNYGVEIWNYLYSGNYGSPEISILHPERKVEQGKPNRDALVVRSAKLQADGRTVFLRVDGMQPVMQMKVTWNVDGADGKAVKGELHNSIHVLAKDPGQ